MVRAAVQTGPLAYEIRSFPRPVVGPDEGLLRVDRNDRQNRELGQDGSCFAANRWSG